MAKKKKKKPQYNGLKNVKNLRGVNIPKKKDPKSYNPMQRRSEILILIEQAGHPGAIKHMTLAERYGKSPSMITVDIEIIKKFLRQEIGKDADVITHVFYDSAIKTLMKQQKIPEAGRLIKDWNDWLFNTGKQDKTPEKIEVNAIAIRWEDGEEDNDKIQAAAGSKRVPSKPG